MGIVVQDKVRGVKTEGKDTPVAFRSASASVIFPIPLIPQADTLFVSLDSKRIALALENSLFPFLPLDSAGKRDFFYALPKLINQRD